MSDRKRKKERVRDRKRKKEKVREKGRERKREITEIRNKIERERE